MPPDPDAKKDRPMYQRSSWGRRATLGVLTTIPASLFLPGCSSAAADLPPPPTGTRPFTENGSWEMVHGQFADNIQRIMRDRYGMVHLTDYALPRGLSWNDVVRYYDPPLIGAGWQLDEWMSGVVRRGHLRVWSGGWRRAWRGALAIALLERPDPDGLGLGHTFLVGATEGR